MTLPVAEVFGPTWQGEGPHLGRRCSFVRLGGCNLTCEWCDTPYTWDATRFDVHAECPPRDVAGIVSQLGEDMVVLTGGEPLLHVKNPDLRRLLEAKREWHVETNGTIPPPMWMLDFVSHFTVSPKVDTRDPLTRRVTPMALTAFAILAHNGRACLKFVARSEVEVDVASKLADEYEFPRDRVYIMAEGTTPEQLLRVQREIAPAVEAHGLNMTTRLHVLLWGDQRGR